MTPTSLETVYKAFLIRMEEDDWTGWTIEELEADWLEILKAAIPFFKFPKKSLDIDGDYFVSELDNREVQIIANYMKCEWLNRTILTWQNVKPLYEERDFSQANLLLRLQGLLEHEEKKAIKLERIYYRAIENKPFDYTRLAKNE